MIYCKKCGAQLQNEAKYCSQCGTFVKEIKTEELKASTDDLVKTMKQLLQEGT
jgi:uncharacterized membrane protein YvbJ